jgi:cytoskeletal protein CcmA (bactofilin family)
MAHSPPVPTSILATLLAGFLLFSAPLSARAGCGCEKPPPPPASVRPQVAYTGTEITLFHPTFQPGQMYTVTFTASTTGASAMVDAKAVNRRDMADRQYKPQVNVLLPTLPLGPASISVYVKGQSGAVLALADDAFTVAPQPLRIPAKTGAYQADKFEAAVSRQGVVYFSVDMTEVTNPMVFRVWTNGYPLRFEGEDVVFYNSQGYLMQLLDGSIPGLFTLRPANKDTESDILQYSRHEFNTFFLQHKERQNHALDPNDPNWHGDGTPHIDHDHLIIALTGKLSNSGKGSDNSNAQQLPTPGATRKFKLNFETSPLVQSALLSEEEVEMSGKTQVLGSVVSNEIITLNEEAEIDGDARAFTFDIQGKAKVSGKKFLETWSHDILPVYLPKTLVELGDLALSAGQSLTLGPGSYRVSNFFINGGHLVVDNKKGPVTLYVMGTVEIQGEKALSLTNKDAEEFALYVASREPVRILGRGEFRGVLYAPQSEVTINGESKVAGAIVGRVIRLTDKVEVNYDKSLDGK